MKVLVVLRAVVDASDELPLADGQLDEDGAQLAPNEFDEYALEEALHLKTAAGATVTVVAPAAAGARILHTALARGADSAIRLDADVALAGGSFALSAAVAPMVSQSGFDLVLTGVQTPDDIFGQLAPLLAARLGWPQASGVSAVESAGSGKISAVQELESGRTAKLVVTLPAVLGVQTSRAAPSYVSATKLKQVMQGSTIATASGEGAPSSATVVAIAPPQSSSRVTMLSDDPDKAAAELAAILTAESA